jgi:hypothetical protein
MSNFHKTIDRYLAAAGPAGRPPDWMVAPHLRRPPARRAPIRQIRNDNDLPVPPSPPPSRARLIPFPEWRASCGVPLATLLGPPQWRSFTRS